MSVLDAALDAAGYRADGPGVAVAARRPDGSAVTAARGLARPGVPFTTDTVSYTGSLAKQFVGACAATLALDGRLDPHAAVRDWLPGLPGGVRVRHLVHHTGGLPDDRELVARIGDPPRWDTPSVLRALASCPLRFEPGSRYRYCNAGYIVLASILARITAAPLPELARRLLFAPLGMSRSAFRSDAPPRDGAPGRPAEEGSWPQPLSLGDGGAWSTVDDLHRWNAALLPGGGLADPVRRLMHTPGRLDDGRPLDYAWGVRVSAVGGAAMQSHGGAWPGWTAKAIRFPESGGTIAALSNDGNVDRMIDLCDRVVRVVATSYPEP